MMTSIGRHFSETFYDEETCRKISLAIKKSKMFAHISPMNLLKQKMGREDIDSNFYESAPPSKKTKIINPRQLGSPLKCVSSGNITLLPTPELMLSSDDRLVNHNEPILPNVTYKVSTVETISNDKVPTPLLNLNVSKGFLPSPESLFDDNPTVIAPIFTEKISSNEEFNIISEEYLKTKNVILEKFADANKSKVNDNNNAVIPGKAGRNDKCREKQNKNLFSLATSLLPIPSQLYDKESLINALVSDDIYGFIDLFKEGIKAECQLSSNDFCEVFACIVKENKLSVLPEFCSCLEFSSIYAEDLSSSFIKYINQTKLYHDNILNCLLTMMDLDISSTIASFIRACLSINDWNRMWSCILTKYPSYKFEDKYFNACMAIFQNLNNNSIIITHDTMLIIINYIMKNYSENYEIYMADIWLYCVLTTEINSETDLKVPEKILDKVIDKLILMKNPSFIFIMKLLSKNCGLFGNNQFSVWLAQLISEKSDIKQCLLSLQECINASNENEPQIHNDFLLLSLNVISLLNKRSLFTSSKKIYDTFLHNQLGYLNSFLLKCADKLKFKCIMFDHLMSTSEYQKAFLFLKDFEMLKDLERTSIEYNSVRDMTSSLVRHLANGSHLLLAIDLFEKILTTFILNDKNDNSYIKNCGDIFYVVVVKVFESNDTATVKRTLLLLDQILSADNIDLKISKNTLRYLLVGSVRVSIPFNELLDLIEQYFKYSIFDCIQTADDGFGSFVNVSSSLTVEEIVVLTSWLCRHVKIKLVEFAQSEGASVKGNLMKICNLKFFLHPSKSFDDFAQKIGSNSSFDQLLIKFTESLNSPKYLSHAIKFTSNKGASDDVTIVCDNRNIYNTIYYSDI